MAADDEADSSSKIELSGSNLEPQQMSEYVLKLWRYSGQISVKVDPLSFNKRARKHCDRTVNAGVVAGKGKAGIKKEKDEFVDKTSATGLPQPQFYPQRELSSQSQGIQNITKSILQKKILM